MLYVPNSVEDTTHTAASTATLPHHGLHHNGSSPRRQSMEVETSFDSGYFSPLASRRSSFAPVPQHETRACASSAAPASPSACPGDPSALDELNRSRSGHLDMSLLDDWDKNFIDNFEENLFSLDCDDMGLLEGIFKSPLKSPLRILSPSKGGACSRYSSPSKSGSVSPYKMTLQRSPYRHKGMDSMKRNVIIANRMMSYGQAIAINPASQMATMAAYQPEGPKLLTAGIVQGNAVNILSASENTPVTAASHALTQQHTRIKPMGTIHPRQIRKTKENSEPHQHTSRQKLQIARTNFRLSLEKAIEIADCRGSRRKSTQYPQLSKALSNPASSATPSRRIEKKQRSSSKLSLSNPYLDEDAEVPSSWLGSTATEVGAYEVEPQSECKVVIRKKRR